MVQKNMEICVIVRNLLLKQVYWLFGEDKKTHEHGQIFVQMVF